jgi:hypothetical protein
MAERMLIASTTSTRVNPDSLEDVGFLDVAMKIAIALRIYLGIR